MQFANRRLLPLRFAEGNRDHKKFWGVSIKWDQVEKEIGNESDWVIIKSQPKIRTRGPVAGARKLAISRTEQKELERVQLLVKQSRRWRISARDLRLALDGIK